MYFMKIVDTTAIIFYFLHIYCLYEFLYIYWQSDALFFWAVCKIWTFHIIER